MELLFFLILSIIMIWDLSALVLAISSLQFSNILSHRSILPEIMILIPAHNEETVIGATLQKLKDAPARIVVVADHCTDKTEKIVKELGIDLIIHSGLNHSTKADALFAALDILRHRRWTYLLVLDADNCLSANFWTILPRILSKRPEIVQVEVQPANKSISLTTKMITVIYGFLNRIVQRGRDHLGIGANLCGTGMIFRRDVIIEKAPWKKGLGLVEDMNYQIRLWEEGIKAKWYDCIWVYDEKPHAYKAAVVQGSRWVRGKMETLRLIRPLMSKRPVVAFLTILKLIPKPIFWLCLVAIALNVDYLFVSWATLIPLCLFPWFIWILPSIVCRPYRIGPEAVLFPFWQMSIQLLHLFQAIWDREKGWRPTKHYGIR